MKAEKTAAIILAAGQGKRMQCDIQKQYLPLNGKPMIYYSLKAFQESCIHEMVLVVGAGEVEYVQNEIVNRWGFYKVKSVVEGGKERYHSVYEGLKMIPECDYVLIHDGARPLITDAIIETALSGAIEFKACAVGVPAKDTIKVADKNGFADKTPDRKLLWQIQTPQAFFYPLIRNAYELLFQNKENQNGITDDAMVVETMSRHKVKLVTGSYLNLKVTTPEDIAIAQVLLNQYICEKSM